jgi:hypothetical protein
MASSNDDIFPESMEDIVANPVDIYFSSMPAKSIAPAACFVIEGNAVTIDQQIRTDLLTETHPPTPSDLITEIDRIEGMLSDTIKSVNASSALAGPHLHPAHLLACATQLT